jgi:hypothetical protein
LEEEDLDRTMWKSRFGKGFGPVIRQSTKWMDEIKYVRYHLYVRGNI